MQKPSERYKLTLDNNIITFKKPVHDPFKTKSRNHLEVFHLDQLMRIKSRQKESPIDRDKVYNYWKEDKDRREKI